LSSESRCAETEKINKMQPKLPKVKGPHKLPDGMTEKDLREELKKAYEEILGPFTENGILRITPSVFDKIQEQVEKDK